jgi:uncharacterized protein YkwD
MSSRRYLQLNAALFVALFVALFATGCGLELPTVRTPTRPDGVSDDTDNSASIADQPQDLLDDARACVQLGSPRTQAHNGLFTLLNDYRQRNGLNRLGYSRTLEQAADQYALRMFSEDFFEHVAPDGSEPADRALAAGFCDRFVGENLAYGHNQVSTAQEALTGFIDSPPHNENMLREQWDYVGIGYLEITGFDGVEYWWVQLFGTEQSEQGARAP